MCTLSKALQCHLRSTSVAFSSIQSCSGYIKSSSENGERLFAICAEWSGFPWSLAGKAVGTRSR